MAVFRVERNTGYTVMSNHHLRNKELSLKAKGLLSQMLSLPEDWDYCINRPWLRQGRLFSFSEVFYSLDGLPHSCPWFAVALRTHEKTPVPAASD